MDYLALGQTGLKVSRLCLGCMSYGSSRRREWILDEEQSFPFFKQAVEGGINFFDTADMYSGGLSEEVAGRALKKLGLRREEIVIASKLYYPTGPTPNEFGTSRKHVRHAIDGSLRRLGVDYVDLYQIHRYDRTTPMEETLAALTEVVNQGKALYIGASSMYAWEFARFLCLAETHGYTRFVAMQNHYNLIYREEEREMIPLCREEKIAINPWSPLARGFLAGNRSGQTSGQTTRAKSDQFAHRLYYQDCDFAIVDRVTALAKKRGVSNAQIALAWMLHQPGITAPIIGATKSHHLEEAIRALQVKLSPQEIRALEEPYQPHPILGIE
ncbi:MAG TPA: aldo/keto reductase [Chthoniobacterales bacterium]|nr:aldo/keto reductase [Chthoniobacterales bacterium]